MTVRLASTRGLSAATHFQTERMLDGQVRDVLALLGYTLVYHTWRSDHSAAGFPDLVAVRPCGPRPRTVFLELKGHRGRLSPSQQTWLQSLQAAGMAARVVYPADLEELVTWLA